MLFPKTDDGLDISQLFALNSHNPLLFVLNILSIAVQTQNVSGRVPVPDERYDFLCEHFQPARYVVD